MKTRGERVIDFIHQYCLIPEGSNIGQPIELLPFQKQFILDVYSNPHGTRQGYLSIARKNGKTAIIACLLLAHLVGPEAIQNSQIVSGARSREQASLVFNLACKMISLSPTLSKIIKIIPSSKRLIGLPMNVEYKALAAEGKTAHGLSPALAILDEVGQVRGAQDDFVDAITTSQGAYDNPLLLAISTQAATDADLFSIWLDDAAKGKDKQIVSHVYAADADCDLMDKKQWQKANPALGVFRNLEDVRQQADKAVRMPTAEATFRNLILNQRVNTTAPFVSVGTWKANAAEPDMWQEFDKVTAGLDLSMTTDLTAFVVTARKGSKYHVFPYFWLPEEGLAHRSNQDKVPYDVWAKQGYLRLCAGKVIDYLQVAKEISEIMADIPVTCIAFDRWRIEAFKRDLDTLGLDFPLMEWGQGFKDMSPALDKLESALISGNVLHGNQPVLNMCAVNAVVKSDPAGGRKLDKSKATGRIDGMVALAMAFGVMDKEELNKPSVYEDRGVIMFE